MKSVKPTMPGRTRPFFLGGDGSWAEGEILLEAADCLIVRTKDLIDLTPAGPWTKRHTKLAKRYRVNSVSLDSLSFGDGRSADLLLDLPVLRRLSLSLWSPIDLSALERLRHLRSLRLDLTVWRCGDHFDPVDLSNLGKLQFADVMMCRAFESILTCRTITELAVGNSHDGRLRELDLTRLPRLRDLALDHCPLLRSVRFHPEASVRGLKLALCGSYRIDWQRIGPNLQYFSFGGRLTFPLDDILQAPNLEELHLWGIRKVPALGFLRKLPQLKVVNIFSAPPGPKLRDGDRAVIREIKARAGQEAS
jgi:hypothetical protein